MQTLTQPQANQLADVLAYANQSVQHPDVRFLAPNPHEMSHVPSSQQIRESAEKHIRAVEEYERFRQSLSELLTLIKTFDYSTALDAATVESAVEPKTAVLGELLVAPEKFEHLGKRDNDEPTVIIEDKP